MTKNTIFSFLQACEATVIKTAQKSWKGATIGALAILSENRNIAYSGS